MRSSINHTLSAHCNHPHHKYSTSQDLWPIYLIQNMAWDSLMHDVHPYIKYHRFIDTCCIKETISSKTSEIQSTNQPQCKTLYAASPLRLFCTKPSPKSFLSRSTFWTMRTRPQPQSNKQTLRGSEVSTIFLPICLHHESEQTPVCLSAAKMSVGT